MARQYRHPGVPISLANPDALTADARRAIAGAQAANGEPDASDAGFHTKGARWLHITVHLPDAATSLEWALWTWNSVDEKWCIDTRLGTEGIVVLASTDNDNPQRSLVEIDGAERVYIQLLTFAGVFTTGADVWLAGNGLVHGG